MICGSSRPAGRDLFSRLACRGLGGVDDELGDPLGRRPEARRDVGDGRRVGAGLTIIQWQDGTPVTVYPPRLAVSEAIWPKN